MSAPRFHTLTIREIRRETPEAVSIAFAVPDELAQAYHFEQGQYLTLRATISGEDIRRSYSICTGEDDGELRVAIKAVGGGAFSGFANRDLKAGDRLEVMTPMGRFGAGSGASGGGEIVAFAAGSGITPVLSIIRTRLARDRQVRVTLFYGNRNSASILFKEALEDLKDRYLGRFSVHHILSREAQDIALLNGRLTAEKITTLMRTVSSPAAIGDVYLCGPERMIMDGRAALEALGVPAGRVHAELFTPGTPAKSARRPVAVPPDMAGIAVAITHDGQSHNVLLRPGETVLEAGERAGLDLPFSCRGGMCCTCRARITQGEASMDVNFSLEPWEVAAGFVLACQCRPAGGALGIDFDAI